MQKEFKKSACDECVEWLFKFSKGWAFHTSIAEERCSMVHPERQKMKQLKDKSWYRITFKDGSEREFIAPTEAYENYRKELRELKTKHFEHTQLCDFAGFVFCTSEVRSFERLNTPVFGEE